MSAFLDLFKDRKPLRPNVILLRQQFAKIASIDDAGERLLAYADFKMSALGKVKMAANDEYALAGLCFIGAVAAVSIAAIAIFPGAQMLPLLGTLAGLGGLRAWYVQGRDQTTSAIKALDRESCSSIANLKNENPLSFSASRRFDEVMKKFPDLRARFVFAAAKDAANVQAARISPRPVAKGPAALNL
ncbi:MAG: hypothetical protein GC185_06755 [Alphaproteobacteria bacterium]|nr:hypothetical protein [Alphaproteobacteria bacterium]